MNGINWDAVGAIAQIFAAIATFAAVIVALWQARYANKKRIKLQFTEDSHVYYENGVVLNLAALTVSNTGNRIVIVQNWGFVIDKKRNYMIIQDPEDMSLKGINTLLPHKIKPEESISLVIKADNLYRNLRYNVDRGVFKPDQYIKVFVTDSTGKIYKARIPRTVAEIINNCSY